MGHTWSLSVEELFYLVWPAIIFLLGARSLLITTVVLIVCANVFKFWQLDVGTEQMAFLSLPANLDGLMCGALLAQAERRSGFRWKSAYQWFIVLLFTVTVVLIIALHFTGGRQESFIFKILLSISVVWLGFFTILLIGCRESCLTGRFLSQPLLLWLGRISYGIYLYHIIIYRFFDAAIYHYEWQIAEILVLVLKILFTIVFAAASWWLIEAPVLKMKDRWGYR